METAHSAITSRRTMLLILGALFLFIFLMRIPILTPMGESDEVAFCIMGNSLANGAVLYEDVSHFKGPVRYYLFGLYSLLTGELTPVSLRISLVFTMYLSAVFLFFAVQNLFQDLRLSTSVAFFWGISDYLLSHNTIPTYTQALLALLFFSLYHRWGKIRYLFLMGLLFGTAFLTNQRSYPLIAIPGLYFLIRYGLRKEFWIQGTITIAGYLLPFVAIVTWFHYQGNLDDYIFQTFFKARAYSAKEGLLSYLWTPFGKLISVSGYQMGLLMVPFFSGLYRVWKERNSADHCRGHLFLIIWLLLTFAATIIDEKFVKRYNLYFLIPMIILSFREVPRYVEWYSMKTARLAAPLKGILTVIILIITFAPVEYALYKESTRRVNTLRTWQATKETRDAVADYLANNLDKEKDTFYVFPKYLGYDSFVHYRPGVRYLYSQEQLLDTEAAASPNYRLDESWRYFYEDMERNIPRVVIDMHGNRFNESTDYGNEKMNAYRDRLVAYINAHYRRDTTIAGHDFYVRK